MFFSIFYKRLGKCSSEIIFSLHSKWVSRFVTRFPLIVISRIFDVLQWVARIVFIKGSKWFSRPQRCGEGHGVCSVYKKFIYNVWIHVKCGELDEIMSESPGVEWLPAYSPGPPRHSPLGPIPRFLYEDVQPLSFHQENNNKESELETTNKIKHAKPAYR